MTVSLVPPAPRLADTDTVLTAGTGCCGPCRRLDGKPPYDRR
jgi:hypothetical protein